MKTIDVVLRRARPLFVAFERNASIKKRHRGRLFGEILTAACVAHHIMILDIAAEDLNVLTDAPNPTKWDVAATMASSFPEVAHKLPQRRKAWQGEDDRVGLFIALAVAVAAWGRFRPNTIGVAHPVIFTDT